MKPRVLLLVAIAMLAAASAQGAGEFRTIEVESLKITIDSEWGQRTAPGYLPVRFDIANLGEARVIDIVGQGTRYFRTSMGGRQPSVTVRQTVRLARGDRVRLTIPVPVSADSENVRFEIQEAGRVLERFNFTGFVSKSPLAYASALLVVDPGSPFGKEAVSWVRPMTATTASGVVLSGPTRTEMTSATGRATMTFRPPPAPPLDFVLDPSRVPTNWLGYTSLRAVVIGPAEWGQLNDAQKSALLTWTACGGDLLFVDGDPAALFPSAPPRTTAGAVRAYFFGRIHVPTLAAVSSSGLAVALTEAAAAGDSNFALPANRTSDWGVIAERGFRLPIPGVEGIPARSYLSILLVFSLLIGPVNYWVLWRAKRQVLVVLTAPIISAIFIVLLAGYVLAGEGFGVRGRAVTFTMLDQVRKQASTRASVSLYAAGTTPSGGLRFARDVAVFAIGPDGTGSREQLTLDLTESQRYADGLIQARSPTNLEEVAFRPARERLGFSRDAAGPSVVNGLGETVTALLYRDAAGTLYAISGPLASGSRVTLKPGALRGSDVVPPNVPLSARLLHLFDHLPNGAYLAVLERSPFWDPGVAGVDERGSFHVVFGWPEGQPS